MRTISICSLLLLAGCSSHLSQHKFDEDNWRYATDPHGSQVILSEPLVQGERVKIAFDRVPRVDKANNSWVELIYDIPAGDLTGISSIELTYQSDKPLVIKLSQKEYGGEGDKSYAHYQVVLPVALNPTSKSVELANFNRPSWTPTWSKDQGVIKTSVSALYFVPDLTDKAGGQAQMTIHKLVLH
ncbi:hypothetical protein [Pseudoalteromonas luteoviolacea]|uniref:Lipoprotein n=1 Tax=Pseudoalteromonas luteoviolacea DSM 6061 TaxID=1365250 RepID=A0A161ZVI1_9GAMM|nr:hypothetical protein [Pseudoalteromonas luteoviolacea]KZN35099.1 hypothetical protein N475_03105 [Pseudoalteromonas luteoviolacea DSM 6061]KZN52849.1 hypothetical protein N474_02740 [Pseudoalteromonas luteoviolacea CPMOR-2]MBE0384842.1 hypothetical protein [Pseudoalteromonas luteoviolacea DSM 6061]TQF66641.1 hypothetical protein FLM44_23940 [Pseudoalteromonas luteoviolacea]